MMFSPPAARRVLPLMALACAAALATGCGPDDPASSGPEGIPATSTSGATAPGATAGTPAGTATPKATGASNGGTAAAACPTRYLQATVGGSQGTAGSTYTVIDFKNLSQSACTLYGYPGVSLAGGTPIAEIGQAATRTTSPAPQLVTLAPGATGNVTLQITDAGDYSPSDCRPATATYLQIYPPGQTTPIYLSYSSPACAGHVRLLTVGPVLPGAGGTR